ncbi:MAG: hypothetical protein IPM42_00370 [Saprospiraceae bacterium]|nr:hypothetical protein [Saprospiraceae bacterium]
MNKITVIILFFLFATLKFVGAQNTKVIALEYDGQKISYYAFNNLKSILETNLQNITFNHSSIIVIQPGLKHTGLKTIEGMDTKKVGISILSLKIRNVITMRDTILKFSIEVAGKNENELDGEVIRQFIKDQKMISSISTLLNEYFGEFMSNIPNLITKIREIEILKDIQQAMQMTYKLEATLESPNPELLALRKELKEKYDKQVCEKSLYEAQILINSGVEYQMNRAVNLLLQIPPSATCKTEALKLSEDLFTKMKITSINREKLNQYKNLMNQNNEKLWMELNYGGQ